MRQLAFIFSAFVIWMVFPPSNSIFAEGNIPPVQATLSLSPTTQNCQSGSTTTLDINLSTENGAIATNVEIGLAYDYSVIEITEFTPGTSFPSTYYNTPQYQLRSDSGNKGLFGVSTQQTGNQTSGQTIFGTITIQCLATGASTIEFLSYYYNTGHSFSNQVYDWRPSPWVSLLSGNLSAHRNNFIPTTISVDGGTLPTNTPTIALIPKTGTTEQTYFFIGLSGISLLIGIKFILRH